MFTGLDEIDWESLRHAGGSAQDVPAWIRGSTEPDAAAREQSLVALYSAFHHEGDVYDSTVAVVPHLVEALTMPGRPGRAALAELLTSIAELSAELAELEMHHQAVRAHALVVAAAPDLTRLADDPDPAVRTAAPKLLLAAAVPDLADRLIGVLETEPEPAVRRSLLHALGRLHLGDDTIGRLLTLDRPGPASSTLAALIAVARTDPHRVSLDDVPDLIDRAYAEEDCTRLLESVTDPLGPRVAERTAIVTPLLSSPHDDLAGDALFATGNLIRDWRGDYREAVTRVAKLLDRSPQLAGRAATVLEDWGPVAEPAADTVARHLADLGAQWFRPGRRLHPYLSILAGLGDERALPLLLSALSLPQHPDDLGFKLARYVGHADRITAEIAPHLPIVRADDQPFEWVALQYTLRAFGPGAAPAVPRLLASPLTDDSAVTLGRIGPAAAEALPALREAAAHGHPRLAVTAAGALWRINRSPQALGLLTAHLDGPAAGSALVEIAEMGPAAASAAPLVAGYLHAQDLHWWTPAHAALAVWRLTGDTDRAAPVLTAAWHGNPHTRTTIAEAATGALAAALHPLFHAELEASQRYNVSANLPASARVPDDERLQKLCRAGVALS